MHYICSVCSVFWLRKLATSPKPRISQCIKIKLMTYCHDITMGRGGTDSRTFPRTFLIHFLHQNDIIQNDFLETAGVDKKIEQAI
jgi:hypothetical protein